MSQMNCHKVPLRGEKQGVQRSRGSVKASGDATMRCKPAEPRSKSRSNKIPKNLRFELENALVGLCDVWFEEIKPHLVRNNIKLHISSEVAAAAGGDHEELPAGAPGCSHLDPGAASDRRRRASVNCVGCSSTQPVASRAPCRRRPPRPRSPRPHPRTESDYRDVDRKWRRRRRPQQPPPHDWRVPRICRTYSLLNARNTCTETNTANKIPNHQRLKTKRKICIDKSTQTEISQISMNHQGTGVKSTTIRPRANGKHPSLNLNRSKSPKSPSPTQSQRNRDVKDSLDSPYREKLAKASAEVRIRQEGKICIKTVAGPIGRQKNNEARNLGRMALKSLNGEKCDTDQALQLLYQNPKHDDPNSIMNLVMMVHKRHKYKKVPWR